jgi:hypothetical protein
LGWESFRILYPGILSSWYHDAVESVPSKRSVGGKLRAASLMIVAAIQRLWVLKGEKKENQFRAFIGGFALADIELPPSRTYTPFRAGFPPSRRQARGRNETVFSLPSCAHVVATCFGSPSPSGVQNHSIPSEC